MKIGNLELNGYAALAPMAGVADRAMREMCINSGAAFCVTELISAKGVVLGDKKSKELMKVAESEQPIAIQLFGSDPQVMARAAAVAEEFSPAFIDINMGCPAPKVAGNGGGSSLMKDPALCGKIVKACTESTTLPVTVKIRAGWDENSLNATEVAKYCEDGGAAAITVHGRTKVQMYAPPVNLDIIKAVKKSVSVPVIGNGDVNSATAAAKMYEATGCDFVMVGRAAMGDPWIFGRINAYICDGTVLPPPPLSYRMVTMINQVKSMMRYKSEKIAILEARKQTAYYMRYLKGAADLRRMCSAINSLDDVVKIAQTAINMQENSNNT